MDRRQLLAAAGLLALAACTPGSDMDDGSSGASAGPTPGGGASGTERLAYGDHPSQFVDVCRRTGTGDARGTVVLVHGGFWMQQYDLAYLEPLAAASADRGWDVASLEYRRVGGAGGFPQTFDDVAAGLDALADWVRTPSVVTLGHSAGGHLAVWAAGRPQMSGTDWDRPLVPVSTAISLAGVLNLQAAHDADLGNGATVDLMGGPPDDRWPLADPTARIPLDVPVRCVHAADDDAVPMSQSFDYVDRAVAAGADATLTEVTGGHFEATQPGSPAAETLLDVLDASGA